MTCHQVLQGFPGISEVLLHRNSNMSCLYCARCCKYFCLTSCGHLQFEYDGNHLENFFVGISRTAVLNLGSTGRFQGVHEVGLGGLHIYCH